MDVAISEAAGRLRVGAVTCPAQPLWQLGQGEGWVGAIAPRLIADRGVVRLSQQGPGSVVDRHRHVLPSGEGEAGFDRGLPAQHHHARGYDDDNNR